MNRKKMLVLPLLVVSLMAYSQVGINTESPKSTLDVSLPASYQNGNLAGLSFPSLTGDQAELMSTVDLKPGTMIYASSISTNANKDIDTVGYWYWTGDSTKKWEPLNLSHKSVVSYFYAPSIVLPVLPDGVSVSATDPISYNSTDKVYSVKLFDIYQKQYGLTGNISGANRTALKNPAALSLPTLTSLDLDYFVTYFDNLVFDPATITVNDQGTLTYKIVDNSVVSENTYMNIVFKVK